MISHPTYSRPRRILAASALVLAPVLLAGCGTGVTNQPTEPAESSRNITLTNCGRELQFTATPSSIVGLMPSQTELLLRLGAQDNLVGQAQVDTYPLPDDLADQAANIPVLSTDTPPAREDLLKVSPDLVVSPTEYEFNAESGFASIDQLAQNGAQAYVATGGCADRRNTAEVTDVFTDVSNLGAIVDSTAAADELISDGRARLTAVQTAIAGKPRPTVAQVYVEGNTLGAIGAGVEADIIASAGGENVFDPDAAEFKDFFATEINPEEIIARTPDAIVFGTTSAAQEKQVRAYLQATFPDVPAVKNNVVIAVPQSDLYPGTLGNVDAVEAIAAALYPEAF